MVAKLFWQDPYRTSLDTRIAAVEGDVVRLEETIFYAFCGGQDQGMYRCTAAGQARESS